MAGKSVARAPLGLLWWIARETSKWQKHKISRCYNDSNLLSSSKVTDQYCIRPEDTSITRDTTIYCLKAGIHPKPIFPPLKDVRAKIF